MTSPITFGDACAIAKIALRIGKAFTKGRKSAPAEFIEVEHQLYSLATALDALGSAVESDNVLLRHNSGPAGLPVDPIKIMLENCRETMNHLDEIVTSYGCLRPSVDGTSGELLFKRWRKSITINWRKIQWTTKGEDLATLRSQLTLHTNSLSLALAAVNASHSARTEANISKSTDILQDIYQWFLENLKSPKPQSSLSEIGHSTTSQSVHPLSEARFELSTDSFLCPRASFAASDPILHSGSLFQCCCTSEGVTTGARGRHSQVAALGLSEHIFPLRLSGNLRLWILHKARNRETNVLETVRLKLGNLKGIAQLEGQLHQLALLTARDELLRGRATVMANLSQDCNRIRILDTVGDLSATMLARSVTFSFSGKSITQGSINSIELFQYKYLPVGSLTNPVASQLCHESYETTAEVMVSYNEVANQGDDLVISKTVITLGVDTEIGQPMFDGTGASLKLGQITCINYFAGNEEGLVMKHVSVCFSFEGVEGANAFQASLHEMQSELWVISRKHPRDDEQVVLQLIADDVSCEDLHIEGALVRIVESRANQHQRLIIQSQNGSTTLSQELGPGFMASLSRDSPPEFGGSTDVIQMRECDGGVTRQILVKRGLSHLQISATCDNRVLGLGIGSIAGRGTRRIS